MSSNHLRQLDSSLHLHWARRLAVFVNNHAACALVWEKSIWRTVCLPRGCRRKLRLFWRYANSFSAENVFCCYKFTSCIFWYVKYFLVIFYESLLWFIVKQLSAFPLSSKSFASCVLENTFNLFIGQPRIVHELWREHYSFFEMFRI